MGFEPMTPCLPGKYSSQLSYSPKFVSLSWPSHYAAGMSPHCAVLALLPEGCLVWALLEGRDLNPRTLTRFDLQSNAFNHSATFQFECFYQGVAWAFCFYQGVTWIFVAQDGLEPPILRLWASRDTNFSTAQYIFVVTLMGLEPIRHSAHAPQTCLSTISNTRPFFYSMNVLFFKDKYSFWIYQIFFF